MKHQLTVLLILIVIAGCGQDRGVNVNGESLHGEILADSGVQVFRGIPFAEPPIGDLRWRAPVPYQGRGGERDATAFAPACMQHMGILDWYRGMAEKFGSTRDEFEDLAISEDCLYLNIWTPSPDASESLPVMVYIHGGSNDSGWAYEPDYHGHVLAERGVVMVSIAYRLGVFGFLSHPELGDEEVRANFGLWDQVAALEWVRDNVARFGGDPQRITLFGESAGAQDILALMAAPPAAGLFHGAILQSNAGFGIGERGTPSIEQEQNRGVETAALFGFEGAGALDALREVTADRLLSRYLEAFPNYYHSPAVGGRLLPRSVWDVINSGELAPLPMIIGSNGDEWYDRAPPDADEARILATAEMAGFTDTDAALQAVNSENDVRKKIDRIGAAGGMVCPSQHTAAIQARAHENAWVYYFTRIRDGAGGALVRAYHGAELPYVFGTHARWITTTDVDLELTQHILDYWTQFAASGNPNRSGNPKWPVFAEPDYPVMEFGDTAKIIAPPEPDLCALFRATHQGDLREE